MSKHYGLLMSQVELERTKVIYDITRLFIGSNELDASILDLCRSMRCGISVNPVKQNNCYKY